MIIETNNIPPELSGGTLRILCAVHDLGEPTCEEIAERIHTSLAAVHMGSGYAEVSALLSRGHYKDDERDYTVQLTDIGAAIVNRLKPENSTDISKELLEALRAITEHPLVDLHDIACDVQDKEGKGWGGDLTHQWHGALIMAAKAITKAKEAGV